MESWTYRTGKTKCNKYVQLALALALALKLALVLALALELALALALVLALELVVALALVSFSWIGMARLVRGQVLSLKQTQYVDAAVAAGASTTRVLFVHLLPNAIGPIIVTVSMGMGALVGTEIILSWLGLGIQPPRPSLGTMLLEAGSISALRVVPWMLIAPGFVAWSLVLCWNLLGDALSDVLNPHTR